MIEIILYLLGTIFFIMLQGFFACSEMSIVSSNKLKIHYLAKQGNKNAEIVESFLMNSHKFLGTTLVGVNVSVVISSTLIGSLLIKIFSIYLPEYKSLQPFVSTLIVGPFVLLFGEVIPLSLGKLHNNYIALRVAPIINYFYFIFIIVIIVTTRIAWLLAKITGTLNKDKKILSNIEELKILFEEGSNEGAIKKDDLEMLIRIFNFKKNIARDIMSPLIQVKLISSNETIENLLKFLRKYKFSRMPVYRDRVDNVVGVINIKSLDLSTLRLTDTVQTIMNKPYFVPETKKIQQILMEMKINFNHFAVVVDEFGGVTGIITIEDIIEEVVGEIEDEFKTVLDKYAGTEFQNKSFEIDTDIELKYLSEKAGIFFPAEANEITTLAGFILYKLGKIPQQGSVIQLEHCRITITAADERKIIKARIEKQ